MQKIFLYSSLLFFLIIAACTSKLDVTNPNAPIVEQFWKTAEDAKAGVNAVYGNFYRIGGYARWIHFNYDLRSDEGYSGSPWLELQNWQKFLVVNYNFVCGIDVWHHHYRGIFRANQVITYVPDIEMDETLKKQYLGEAHFLRALYYFNLASLWGNVPMQLTPSEPTDLPPYSTQAEVWAQIEKDLNEAIAGLPAQYAGTDIGRVTKGAAYALLGKLYMQQRKFDKAKTAFDWLVTGDGKSYYGLMENYQDNFTDLHENNKESVFEVQFSSENQGGPDQDASNSGSGNQRSQFFGPRGVGWSDGQCRRWVVYELLKEKTTGGERDPRAAISCMWDSLDERGPAFTKVYGKTFKERFQDSKEVWFHKYLDDYWRDFSDYYSPINFRVIRFADVMLMYAECLNELGQTGAAYEYVDRVRERAHLARLSVIKPGLTKDQFLLQLKHERICELSGEGTRWNDLVRWGDLDDDAKVRAIAERDSDFENFQVGKHKLLPIPQSEMDINPNLKQNTNW